VSLDAVAQNVRRLVRHAAPAAVMAVVKADAYGHGAAAVARTALQHGASWLAVYTVAEGVELRQSGANAPILVFGPFSAAEAEGIWDHRLTPTLTSLDAAARLQERSAGREIEYHLKLDTGLARAGIAPPDAVDFMRSVRSSFSSLHHTGTYTHFVSADEEDKGATFRQISLYQESIARLEAAGFPSALTHAFEQRRPIGRARRSVYDGSRRHRNLRLLPVRRHVAAGAVGAGPSTHLRSDPRA